MELFYIVVFIIQCIIAAAMEGHNKVRNQREKESYNELCEKKKKFVSEYGATDEEVLWAIYEEIDDTELAQEIKRRLKEEADVDQSYSDDWVICRARIIPMGILAQRGKAPKDFVEGKIDWSAECRREYSGSLYYSDDAAAMMTRFLKWYDNELMEHGFPERLYQLKEGTSLARCAEDRDVVAFPVKDAEKLRPHEPVFWPLSTVGLCLSRKMEKLSSRL